MMVILARMRSFTAAMSRGGVNDMYANDEISQASVSGRFPPLKACERPPMWSRLFKESTVRIDTKNRTVEKRSIRLPICQPLLETIAVTILIMASGGQF